VSAFDGVVSRAAWDTFESRVARNTDVLLDVFDRAGVRATFFVLGWVADRFPALVRRIADLGHEVASHGYSHQLLYMLTPAQFREDIRAARRAIEDAAGQPVLGYRAPSYSVIDASLWALDVLIEEGYAYDASIFPIHHDRYGMPGAPRAPFRIRTASGSLTEYPLTTFRVAGHSFPVGGGGYLRLLPSWYTSMGIKRAHNDGLPIITYIHPWEIDPGQPRVHGASLKSRLRHYTNLGVMEGRIARLLQDFAWGRMDEVFPAIPAVRPKDESQTPCPR
jgi:polysaccharide deacetylase family protein (PEP-CTERM system associated)